MGSLDLDSRYDARQERLQGAGRIQRGDMNETVGAKKAVSTEKDWLPSLICKDVYTLQGESAKQCEKLFYSLSTKIGPVVEKVKNCKPGQIYMGGIFSNGQEMAEKCASQLSKETGKKFWVETERENIGDGMPARVSSVHHHVRGGYQISLEQSMKIYSNVTGHTVFSPTNKY